jgi:hypothetical protein
MTDIDALGKLRDLIADTRIHAVTAGLEALAVLDGWRPQEDAASEPTAPVLQEGRVQPDAGGNPAMSVDAAITFANEACPREWPGIVRNGLSALSRLHHWHTTFPRPGQIEQLPRAILLSTVDQMIEDGTFKPPVP